MTICDRCEDMGCVDCEHCIYGNPCYGCENEQDCAGQCAGEDATQTVEPHDPLEAFTLSPENREAIDRVCELLKELWETIKQMVKTVFDSLSKTFGGFINSIEFYVLSRGRGLNPKVYYLAYHAKTYRARKKNMKRLWRLVLEV